MIRVEILEDESLGLTIFLRDFLKSGRSCLSMLALKMLRK